MELERRNFVVKGMRIERREDNASRIVGHAAVFNQEADIGGWFREKVAPGAFARAIKEDDVRALFNHDSNFVLGRNTAGTLTLAEDDKGLAIEIDPPDTQFARDLLVSIERGDISQMSFGFRVLKQLWDESGDVVKRTLTEVELFDVSPVTFPAYVGTDVSLRAFEEYRNRTRIPATPQQQGKGWAATISEGPMKGLSATTYRALMRYVGLPATYGKEDLVRDLQRGVIVNDPATKIPGIGEKCLRGICAFAEVDFDDVVRKSVRKHKQQCQERAL